MENLAQIIALIFSGTALVVSIITAWLTFFRRGTLKMTRPNVLFLGFDTTPGKLDPKVFLRGLLYSTSKRGQLVEALYVRLSRGESVQNFSVWVHGQTKDLSRGSGLFVGADGVAANHHFLLSPDQKSFLFQAGSYRMQVFARVIGKTGVLPLFDTEIELTREDADALMDKSAGVYFDWGPESQRYYSHIDRRSERLSTSEMLSLPMPTLAEETSKEPKE